MQYRFNECVFDTDAIRLVVRGQTVPVQPQVVDVLKVLIEERERVVSKEELLDRVWGHTFVTESALTSRIKSARQALGDDGQEQRVIRTVHGRGYQFVAQLIDEAPESSTPSIHRSLPSFASELVGRHQELRALDAMLDDSRLVTIVGPGGVGKTRLAIACAGERREQAVAFADLTTVREPSLVLAHIASEIGLHTDRVDTMSAICEYVGGRRVLLVVDNLEHVIDAAEELGDIVRRVDDLTVLATSRERLRLDGERVFVLEPLAHDGTASEQGAEPAAIELFVRTARSVAPDLDLERYRHHVERICANVDGLPLAIELVAGQTRVLPPDMLAARLGERLRSASTTRRDAPARQLTMASTIDWSLRLLDAEERLMFGRMGAFVGDVPLTMVEAVCGDERLPEPLDVLARLVDKSLVRTRTGADGVARFGMLELLRLSASELLAESDEGSEIALRHARAVADGVEEIDRDRRRELVGTWTDLLTHLLPEFRRAFTWATEQNDWELAGRLVAPFGAFWHREGGLADGRRRLDLVLDHESRLSMETRARVLSSSALVHWDAGLLLAAREAWRSATEILETIDDPPRLAFALAATAITTLDDPELHAWAKELLDRAVSLAREQDLPALLVEVLNFRGEFARSLGDDELARDSYVEATTVAAEIGDVSMESVTLANLSYVECHAGNFQEARRLGQRALRMCADQGRRLMASWSVRELAIPASGLGEHELAARLVGASHRAMEALGAGRYPADKSEDDRLVAELIDRLGRAEFDRLFADGAQLGLDEAVSLALGKDGPL